MDEPVPSEDKGVLATKEDQRQADPETGSKQATVKMWTSRIASAKLKWEPDFKQIRLWIKFCKGFQRPGQQSLDTDEYQANLVLRNINQKVAALYARNPTAEFQRRKRLDYQLWDGKMESIQPLAMKVATGQPLLPQEAALVQDFIQGEQNEAGIEKIGKSLEIAYKYQMDECTPDFKLQMKALVRRVCITGVGYVRLSFVREIEEQLTSEGIGNSVVDQAKELQSLLEELQDEDPSTSPKSEQVKSLIASMQATVSGQDPKFEMSERLSFDFLQPTAVIPDEKCTNLKGFIGARYVAIEYILPLDEVNAYFETNVKADGDVKLYQGEGKIQEIGKNAGTTGASQAMVCVYEVLDKTTKSHFFLMDGYKDYLQEPELLEPAVKGFWPIYTLMFNDIESDSEEDVSPFPPSDVCLMMHPQKEWNRSREAWRKQRNANAAKYVTQKGWLTEGDKDKLEFSEDSAVIELEGLSADADINKALVPMNHAPIDQAMFDTGPLLQDILYSVGAQEANLGNPSPDGTATGQSIAEQSRGVSIASNIDDLDDFLSAISEGGGDMLMQDMSNDTFMQLVGPGCAMPPIEAREQYLQEIYLKVVAASSGRPNKVLELQNWNMIVPFLMQAGANPQFIVRETIKRADDRMDPEEAFPLIPQQAPQGPMGPSNGQPPKGPMNNRPRGGPTPQSRPGPVQPRPQQFQGPPPAPVQQPIA